MPGRAQDRPRGQRQISLEHDDLAGPAGLASETVTLQLTRHRPDPGGPRLPRPGWPGGPATAGLIRREWLAVLCGGFAVFAAVTGVISADPAQRAWGMFATGGYCAAPGRRGRRAPWGPRGAGATASPCWPPWAGLCSPRSPGWRRRARRSRRSA